MKRKRYPNLIGRTPKRIFAFGCSFTNYQWAMWPELVALQLNIPLYNFGRSGAGNLYISHAISQADAYYNFNENDLVMICWSNWLRYDRVEDNIWYTYGNLWADPELAKTLGINECGTYNRDLGLISLTQKLIRSKGCQYHFFGMSNFKKEESPYRSRDIYGTLQTLFKDELDEWKGTFEDNMITPRYNYSKRAFNGEFTDGHPFPVESLQVLKSMFDHKWTIDKQTLQIERKMIQLLKEQIQLVKTNKHLKKEFLRANRNFHLYMIPEEYNDTLENNKGVKNNVYDLKKSFLNLNPPPMMI